MPDRIVMLQVVDRNDLNSWGFFILFGWRTALEEVKQNFVCVFCRLRDAHLQGVFTELLTGERGTRGIILLNEV